MSTALMQTPGYYEERRKEMLRELEPFKQAMFRIFTHMPSPGFKIDLKTGEWEELPNAPEWQERIDKILQMQQDHIKKYWP